MNQTYLDTMEFVETLMRIQNKLDYPDEMIEYLWRSSKYSQKPMWKDLYDYLGEYYKFTAIHDPIGWYLKTEILTKDGWKLESLSDWYKDRDEALNSVKITDNCIYGYIDRN